MNLKEYRLGDLTEVTRGANLASDYYAKEGKYKRITLGNFNYKEGGFKDDTQKEDIYYTGKVDERFILRKGDILTPLTEQALGLLGSTIRIPEDDKYIQSQDAALITCKEGLLDPDFCYYLISSAQVRNQLSAAAQQTKIRHTSPDKIKACKIFIPDLAEQKKIGQLLRRIEEKISLNKQINQNLEALARQLYDYWFVQFDFPDENGNPYKSSGGKVVWNEQLKRDIPDGWEIVQMEDIIDIKSGFPFQSHTYLPIGKYKIITIKNVQDGYIDINDTDFIDRLPNRIPDYCILRKGDSLISLTGNVGRVGRIYAENLLLNQRVGYIDCKNGFDNWAYLYMTTEQVRKQIEKLGIGSAQSNVSPIQIGKIKMLLPAHSILLDFEQRVKSVLQLAMYCREENISLIKQRNELLPLLMNGQVNSTLS